MRRYERENPGELIHLDIKKLGRIGSVGHRITGRYPGAVNRHHGIGWEFVHVCIDDASRVAFVQIMADQRKESAVAFLEASIAYYGALGIRIERVMTDNGSCYRQRLSEPPAYVSDFARSSPSHIPQRPTARPSALSKPHFANGLTRKPTKTQFSEQPSYLAGSIATIGIGHMVV